MTKNQENKLSTFEPTDAILRENAGIWRGSQGITIAHDAFVAGWHAIDPEARKQVTGSTGATLTKSVQRQALEGLALLISGNIQAFAMATSNVTLEHDMAFTETALGKMRDNVLLITARLIRDTANNNSGTLPDYHVGPQEIRALDDAIDAFGTGTGSPRRTIVAKKTATVNIRETLAACEHQLSIIDRLIQNYRADHHDFVSDYEAARKVIDLGHRRQRPLAPAGGQ